MREPRQELVDVPHALDAAQRLAVPRAIVLVQIGRVLEGDKLVLREEVAEGGVRDVCDGFKGAEEHECVDVVWGEVGAWSEGVEAASDGGGVGRHPGVDKGGGGARVGAFVV